MNAVDPPSSWSYVEMQTDKPKGSKDKKDYVVECLAQFFVKHIKLYTLTAMTSFFNHQVLMQLVINGEMKSATVSNKNSVLSVCLYKSDVPVELRKIINDFLHKFAFLNDFCREYFRKTKHDSLLPRVLYINFYFQEDFRNIFGLQPDIDGRFVQRRDGFCFLAQIRVFVSSWLLTC